MATYAHLTPDDLSNRLPVRVECRPFLPPLAPRPLPPWLVEYLHLGGPVSAFTTSDKEMAEQLIAPLLRAVQVRAADRLRLYSGVPLRGAGLSGVCDFILGHGPAYLSPQPPLLLVCQSGAAGLANTMPGWVGALLSAGELNNQAAGRPFLTYGCLTSGTEWHFLKLTGDLMLWEPMLLMANALPQVLATLDWLTEPARYTLPE